MESEYIFIEKKEGKRKKKQKKKQRSVECVDIEFHKQTRQTREPFHQIMETRRRKEKEFIGTGELRKLRCHYARINHEKKKEKENIETTEEQKSENNKMKLINKTSWDKRSQNQDVIPDDVTCRMIELL